MALLNVIPAVEDAISQYSSPEAAQSDFETSAPQTTAAFESAYQQQTGDWFADPFQNISDTYTRRASIAAAAASRPYGLATAVPNPTVSVGTSGPPVTGAGAGGGMDEAGNFLTLHPLPSGMDTGIATLQLPNQPTSQFTLPNMTEEAQRQRANAVGGESAMLFETLRRTNPAALKYDSTTRQALQYDASGKPIASDTLNPTLYNDVNFQRLLRTNPRKAAGFYAAITGRDFRTDIAAQQEANANRYKIGQSLVEDFAKHGDYDEFGEPFMRVYSKDPNNPFGPPVETQRKLSIGEKVALQRHGLRSVLGTDAPSGPPELMGMTTNARSSIIKTAQELRRQNPNDSLSLILTKAKLAHGIHAAKTEASRNEIRDPRPGWIKGTDVAGQMARTGLNYLTQQIVNPLLRGRQDAPVDGIPQIPLIPQRSTEEAIREYQNRIPITDIIGQGLDFWKQKEQAAVDYEAAQSASGM